MKAVLIKKQNLLPVTPGTIVEVSATDQDTFIVGSEVLTKSTFNQFFKPLQEVVEEHLDDIKRETQYYNPYRTPISTFIKMDGAEIHVPRGAGSFAGTINLNTDEIVINKRIKNERSMKHARIDIITWRDELRQLLLKIYKEEK